MARKAVPNARLPVDSARRTIFTIGKSIASLYHRAALIVRIKSAAEGEYEDRHGPVRSLTLDRFGGSG
jgi:hypothetical protein